MELFVWAHKALNRPFRRFPARAVPVVPQGGNTGLVGGSVPIEDEIVVSVQGDEPDPRLRRGRRLGHVRGRRRAADDAMRALKATMDPNKVLPQQQAV